jgi:16S rRNA (guanine(966)-N(2))-methyltransferase RsmD
MRIIAGKFRGKQIQVPTGDKTRPTTDRVRESVFNLLYSRIDMENLRVLDMFAGTGALGLESISRGAREAVFIEVSRSVLTFCQKNAKHLGVEKMSWFHCADAVNFIKRYRGQKFDVIFADPPYDLPDLPQLPELVLPHLAEGGLFILEHDRRHDFDDHPLLETSRAYGRTIVSVFDPRMAEENDE